MSIEPKVEEARASLFHPVFLFFAKSLAAAEAARTAAEEAAAPIIPA